MRSTFFRAPARRGLIVPATLTLTLLSACGGDANDPPPPVSGNTLVIDEDNAALVSQLALSQPDVFELTLMPLVFAAVDGAHAGCDAGTADLELDADNRPIRATFSDCETDSLSGFDLLVDGVIRLEYEGSSDEIFTLSSDATFEETIDTGTETLRQTTRLNGAFHGAPSSGALDGNYTDINATIAVDSEVDEGTGDPQSLSITLTYGDFGIVSEPQGKDADSLAVNGDITFSELLDGSVSVVTDTLLVQEDGPDCPRAGNLSIAGAEGSSLALSFQSNDAVTATVNGQSTDYDCEQFTDWLESQDPLDRR